MAPFQPLAMIKVGFGKWRTQSASIQTDQSKFCYSAAMLKSIWTLKFHYSLFYFLYFTLKRYLNELLKSNLDIKNVWTENDVKLLQIFCTNKLFPCKLYVCHYHCSYKILHWELSDVSLLYFCFCYNRCRVGFESSLQPVPLKLRVELLGWLCKRAVFLLALSFPHLFQPE